MPPARPHILGVDDGPFEKGQREPVKLVAVMMEGSDLVEYAAVSAFPVDGANATEHLADWLSGLRALPSIQGVVLGGISLAGLGVVDIQELAARLERPVLVVNRRDPKRSSICDALRSAGLETRIATVEKTPEAIQVAEGLYVAAAGTDAESARRLVLACVGKAQVPEPLRIAHLMARALARGESQGRV